MKQLTVDKSWSLFLDRDGVLNKKIDQDYVRNVSQFIWLNNALDSVAYLSSLFGRIFIVSNQQGVGKGLMSHDDVNTIHQYMIDEIGKAGGKVDKIYFAPYLASENSVYRKPNIGMALQAKEEFPDIEFAKCIMVGDSMSDIEFGKKAGMITVMLTSREEFFRHPDVDYCYSDLKKFADAIRLQSR